MVVTNGNHFAARVLASLLVTPPGGASVDVILSQSLRRGTGNSGLSRPWSLFRRWGPRYAAFKATVNMLPPAIERLTNRATTVRGLCAKTGTPLQRIDDLNSSAAVVALRTLSPTLLVSVSCPYLLSSEVLGVPSLGSINVHSSLLPAYAGVSTYVHVLARGEGETGVTVHEMVRAADAGRIVQQARVPVTAGVSAFALFTQQCDLAAELVLRAAGDILSVRRIDGVPQELSRRSYFSDPTATEVKQLRQRGHVLMKVREVHELWEGITSARGTNR